MFIVSNVHSYSECISRDLVLALELGSALVKPIGNHLNDAPYRPPSYVIVYN